MSAEPSDAPGLPLPDALELLAYLVTASELCTREPLHYGMFRLLDAAGRLAGGLERAGAAVGRPWLSEVHARIERDKELLMWDRAAFEQTLHELAALIAEPLAEAAS